MAASSLPLYTTGPQPPTEAMRNAASTSRNRGALLLLLPILAPAGMAYAASGERLRSPTGRLELRVRTGDRLRYDVVLGGRDLLIDSTAAITIDGITLGAPAKLRAARRRSVDESVDVPVPRRAARLRDRFNELRLEMDGRYAVVFRAYDEGIAYRFETMLPRAEVKVDAEGAFRFVGADASYPRERALSPTIGANSLGRC